MNHKLKILTVILALSLIPICLSFSYQLVADDFNYTGPPIPWLWENPHEQECDGTDLYLMAHDVPELGKTMGYSSNLYDGPIPPDPEGWGEARVYCKATFDGQNEVDADGCSVTVTFRASDAILNGGGSHTAWAEIGVYSKEQSEYNQDWWNLGVFVCIGQLDTGEFYIGIQDYGASNNVPVWGEELPDEIVLKVYPNVGSIGGYAECYCDGELHHSETWVYEWPYDDPDYPSEDFTIARVYLFAGATPNEYAEVWWDYIDINVAQNNPSLNSITLRDADSGNEEYSNENSTEVDFDPVDPSVISYMMLSEDYEFPDADWITYEDPTTFELSSGDGMKTVYAKVCDDSQDYVSAVVYDEIFLDTQDPTATCEELPEIIPDEIFDIDYNYSDPSPASEVRWVELWYRKDGGDWSVYERQEPPTGTFSFDTTTTGGDGFYEFETIACDNAGNVEERTGIPETETTVITEISLNSIVLRDTDSESTDYTNDVVVEVSFNTPDEDNAEYMMLSENEDFSGGSWRDYENPTTFTLSTGDELKTVYAKLATIDYTESGVRSDSILLDTTNPVSDLEELPENTNNSTFNIYYSSSDQSPGSGVSLVELWYRGPDITTSSTIYKNTSLSDNQLNPVSLNSKSEPGIDTTCSMTQQDWILYDSTNQQSGHFVFDSTQTGGDGFYQFVSIVEDNAGNRKDFPSEPEAETYVNTQEEGPMPPIITPNDDGYNDYSYFSSICSGDTDANLKIFNRDHILVYEETNTMPQWNGCDSNGDIVQSGVYFYYLESDGETYFGTITVMR